MREHGYDPVIDAIEFGLLGALVFVFILGITIITLGK